MNKEIIIIGSGIAGIACALRLSELGFKVKVFEKNNRPGGKISDKSARDYRFDTGPSLLTMPELINELIMFSYPKTEHLINFKQLEIICKYFYRDGTIINSFRNTKDFASEIENKTGEKKENVLNFLQRSKYMYDLTKELFIFSPFRTFENIFSTPSLNIACKFRHLDSFKTMYERNRLWFTNKKIVQLFNRYATYNGSNPYKAPATLNIIAHLEHNTGAFLPEKGMYNLVDVLYKLARDKGVEFLFSSKVDKIITNGSNVKGVEVKGKNYSSNIVISDVDIFSLYYQLLPGKKIPGYLLKQELSSSAVIFFWGIKNEYPNLEIHNILFSECYKTEFEHIFTKKMIYNDPTVYIYISSKYIPADAPKGCENWFVMINAPNNSGQDWDKLVNEARKHIILKINKILNTNIESYIEYEDYADPRTIENNTASYKGAIYGNSSNSKLAAFLRHKNFINRFKGLYFVGGSVHPGGGIPLCLASAKIVTEKITKSYSLNK